MCVRYTQRIALGLRSLLHFFDERFVAEIDLLAQILPDANTHAVENETQEVLRSNLTA